MVGNLLRRARVPRKDRAASSGPGSSRTGTPACPPVWWQYHTGQTGVSVLLSKRTHSESVSPVGKPLGAAFSLLCASLFLLQHLLLQGLHVFLRTESHPRNFPRP